MTDTIAPVINSFSFSKSTVQLSNPVNLSINVTDNSEISAVWATFRWPNGTIKNYTAFLSSGTSSNGIYTIQFNSTNQNGIYTVTYIFANDTQSNMSYNFSVISFSVEAASTTSSTTPSFSSGGAPVSKPEAAEEKEPEEKPVPKIEKCVEKWVCSEWSECKDGVKTRTCTDVNNCGTAENKPIESETCAVPEGPEEQVPLGFPVMVLPIFSILLLTLIVYIFVKEHNRKKNRKYFKKVR